MIATKKAKLIRKHLGSNTPEWVVKNCMELLKEYEEIVWCGVTESQANDTETGNDKCHIQGVSNSVCYAFDWCKLKTKNGNCRKNCKHYAAKKN